MKKLISAAVQLTATLLFLTSTTDAATITAADCTDFINEKPNGVTCGFITLPLNHDQPDHRSIRLPMLIARSPVSRPPNSSRAVLIPGAGGPGAAMGFGENYQRGEFLQPYQELLKAGFDLVILDQRGAGLSSPRLTCFESIKVFELLITHDSTIEQQIKQYHKATKQCQQRLHTERPEHFDTAQSARDFLRAMSTLNYPWWGTIATSYATVIAQTMLIQNPHAFDKVVLDSPVPLNFQRPITSESTYSSIMKSIARCRQIQHCNERYPDLHDAFDRVLQHVATRPIRLSLNVWGSDYRKRHVTLFINGDTLLSIFANAVYTSEGITALPSIIKKMDRGQHRALMPLAQDYWYQSVDDTYADGLNLTVHCKERQILERQYINQHPKYLHTLSKDSRKVLDAQTDLCAAWGVSSNTATIDNQRFTSPALIISGSLDPVISRDDINNTVVHFTRAHHTQVPGAGHAVWYQSDCVRSAVTQFLLDNNDTYLKHCDAELPGFK